MTNEMAKMIIAKGVDNVNLEMLSPDQRKALYRDVAEILYRQGKTEEAIIALMKGGFDLPADGLKKIAEEKMSLGNYRGAYDFLTRAGQHDMAAFVKTNFLDTGKAY